LKMLKTNTPSTDCLSIKLPIKKKLLSSTPERPLYVVAPKMYYLHEFLMRYRVDHSEFLDKFAVKSEEEILDVSPSVSSFSLTETAANCLVNYLYSGNVFLTSELFNKDNLDNDYTDPEDLVHEIQFLSEILDIPPLKKACVETLDILSQIPQTREKGFLVISLFNTFTSNLTSQDLYTDLKNVYEDTCTKGENYDRRSAPDIKLVFSMASGEEEDPLTPSLAPCIYAHSSILKARCTFFKVCF